VVERMAQRLAARRRQEFVGREPELALLDTLLRGGDGGVQSACKRSLFAACSCHRAGPLELIHLLGLAWLP
jgi:hypothetical protein